MISNLFTYLSDHLLMMFQLPSITSLPLGILPLPFGVHLTTILKGSQNFLVVGQFEKQTFGDEKQWEGAVAQSCIFHSTMTFKNADRPNPPTHYFPQNIVFGSPVASELDHIFASCFCLCVLLKTFNFSINHYPQHGFS